jgi:hypothetical protein
MGSQIEAAEALESAVGNLCARECHGYPGAWRGDGTEIIEFLENDGWTIVRKRHSCREGKMEDSVVEEMGSSCSPNNPEDCLRASGDCCALDAAAEDREVGRRRYVGQWILYGIGIFWLTGLTIRLLTSHG